MRAACVHSCPSTHREERVRYYIRQHRKHVSGPHEVEAIRQWIKAGKVRDEMEFSEDGEDWMLGLEMADLFGAAAPVSRRHQGRRRAS